MIPQTTKNYKGAKHSNADVTLTERNTVPTKSGNPAETITVIVTGKRNSHFVYAICKATYEFFVELSNGKVFCELRFQKKLEAAQLLFPEDMKALIGKTIKMM